MVVNGDMLTMDINHIYNINEINIGEKNMDDWIILDSIENI